MSKTPEFRRTLLIGLGGAGQLTVLNVKRLFLDAYGVMPPSIKILCLDTDVAQAKLRSLATDQIHGLDANEFMHLSVPDPRQFIESGSAAGDWYMRPIPVGAINNGAGAVRQNGRLGLFYHIVELGQRVEKLVSELNDPQLPARMDNARSALGASTDFRLSSRDPEVFVCGSLAGGTGSGTAVDIGILLRAKMPKALIQGCFLLDWPYRSKSFASRVRGNTYAALSEIENLQSVMFGSNDFVPYAVNYAGERIEVTQPPYSLFHLIDGRNEQGQNIAEVGQLCENVATGVFLSVSSMADPVNSVVDNLLTHINTAQSQVWKGKCARYSSLGVSSIYYPARELHRLLAAESALDLCRAAITEVESGMLSARGATPTTGEPATRDVSDFLVRHGIDRREAIRDGVSPSSWDITFAVERFEIADPSLLKPKTDSALAECRTRIDEAAEGDGKVFRDAKLDALKQKLADLNGDATLTTAARRGWFQAAIDRFSEWDGAAARELSAAAAHVAERRTAADAQLKVVFEAHYFPLVGGPRKSAALRWADLVREWLRESHDSVRIEHERRFHDAALKLLQQAMPQPIKATEVGAVLAEAERTLHERVRTARETLERIKALPTQVLVGHGDIVVLPQGNSIALTESQTVSYTSFQSDADIQTPERYLQLARDKKGGIATFLLDYCEKKLAPLATVSVYQALQTIGTHRGNADEYMRDRIDDLFRLAAPMWSFNRSRLTEQQSKQYDKIVNLGVHEQEAGRLQYGEHVNATKARYHLRSEHTFSTTGDPYHVWLLAYAAALPVYALSDLDRSKAIYEAEITPTYHIDPEFEMNVPDVFPADEIANRVLRVLGMAIVGGIDVIRDEKLAKGHKFICDLDAVKAVNFGEPKVWTPGGPGASGTSFRDMYEEFTQTYDPRAGSNLLDLVTAALRARVAAIPQDQLRSLIRQHIDKLNRKLAQRDFSRLYSARLTYREVKSLEDFLNPRQYAMNLERYLEGKA